VLKDMNKPYGVIINRDGIGDDQVEKFCNNSGIKILDKIPNKREIAEYYSRGESLIEYDSKWKGRFEAIIKEIEKDLSK
ncbi:MAG TPA: (4Fe-4S)-binding protein, partial [Actinobacteria bacterium]|nr:(4Fe-4S)-binding protein [Actinomycetota bacterium]